MPHTTQGRAQGVDEPPAEPVLQGESRGCLFALSQPPLMLFLAVIGALLAITGGHDLLML